MNIIAIVVTYNGKKEWYDHCFQSLLGSSLKPDVLVVDNASTDDTVDYIHSHYSEVHIIPSDKNLGFAAANNVGMQYALEHKADYVLLINHDAWFDSSEGLEQMVRIADQHPEYWIISPLQVYASGRIESEAQRHIIRSATSQYDYMSDAMMGCVKELYPIEYACAYCWLLPIKTIQTIGGFDPLFYHYGEDDNYQQRVRYHGGKIALCPQVKVVHDIEGRSEKHREQNLDWRKYLLIQYGNVNMPWNVYSYLHRLAKTIGIQILRLQRKHLQQSIPEFKYLYSVRHALHKSREQNKQKGTNWL